MRFFWVLLLSLTFMEGFSQSSSEGQMKARGFLFGAGWFTTPIDGQSSNGIDVDLLYFPNTKWGTGLEMEIGFTQPIQKGYGYLVGQPETQFLAISWGNRYDFYQTKNFRLGANLNTGLGMIGLYDKSQLVTYETTTTDSYGNTTKSSRQGAKPIAKNRLFMIEPGLNASLKLFPKGNLYLNSKLQYRLTSGSAKFGDATNFSGVYFGLGLTYLVFR